MRLRGTDDSGGEKLAAQILQKQDASTNCDRVYPARVGRAIIACSLLQIPPGRQLFRCSFFRAGACGGRYGAGIQRVEEGSGVSAEPDSGCGNDSGWRRLGTDAGSAAAPT